MENQKTRTENIKLGIETGESSAVDAEKDVQFAALANQVLLAQSQFPVLGDRFEVIEFIGAGGMGRVFKVKDKQLGRIFAVKLLRSELASDAQAVQRFRLECDAVSQLTHPNVVSVYEFHVAPSGVPFIVMDFVDGLNLEVLLKNEGAMEPQRAIRIMEQVLNGVGYAHGQGVLHRDLKPSNIIVKQNDSGEDVAVVLDFGIAAVLEKSGLDSSTITRTGELLGSPQYMSPEQLNGEGSTKASDLFGLGCLFYEMLVGEPVFSENNPVAVIYKRLKEPFPMAAIRRLKPEFTSVISACLETTPVDRYQSVESFSRDLAEIGRGKQPANFRSLKIDCDNVLFKRFVAFVLDGIIIWIVATVIGIILAQEPNYAVRAALLQLVQPYYCFEAKEFYTSIAAVSVILYFVLFEASRLRATPGKVIMNLAVASRFEKLPAIVPAVLRYASKVLCVLALYYVVIAPVDSLGLKPLLPVVTDGAIISIVLLVALVGLLRRGAQLPHDVLFGTRVVPSNMAPESVKRLGSSDKRRLASAAIAAVSIPIVCAGTLFGYAIWQRTHTNSAEIAKATLQLQTDSNNPRLWNKRGRAYMNEKDYDRAVTDFTRSIELSDRSDNFDSFACRGYCYNLLNQYSKARIDLEKAIALSPKKSWPYLTLSDTENHLGLFREAKKHATTGIELSPNGSEELCWLHNNRAVAEIGLAEYSLSLADAERAYMLGGNDLAYALNKGHALYGLGDYYESIELAKKALSLDNNNYRALWVLGLSSEKRQDTARALAYIDRAGRGKASIGFKSRIIASRGDLLLGLSRYDDAIKAYTAAIELGYYGLNGYEVFQSRAEAYQKNGDSIKADADQKEAERRKTSPAD